MVVDVQQFRSASLFPKEATKWQKVILNCNLLTVFAINMTFLFSCSCNFADKIFRLILMGNDKHVSLYYTT